MLPDRVSKPEPLTYESGALPIVLRGRALCLIKSAKDRRTTPGVCGHGSVPLSHLGELGYGNWNLPLTTRPIFFFHPRSCRSGVMPLFQLYEQPC